jgi:hypothetical protein
MSDNRSTWRNPEALRKVVGQILAETIDKALGVPIVWESDGAKHWIIARSPFPGKLIEEHRQEALAWFSDRVNRFVTVFRPRIEALVKGNGLT